MKNKSQVWEGWNGICLLVAILLTIFYSLGLPSQPQYKAYKVECREEKEYNQTLINYFEDLSDKEAWLKRKFDDKDCELFLEINYSNEFCSKLKKRLKELSNEINETDSIIENTAINITRCEDRSVDEVEVCRKVINQEWVQNCVDKETGMYVEFNESGNISSVQIGVTVFTPERVQYCKSLNRYKTDCREIKVEDLTPKFLEENCKCVEREISNTTEISGREYDSQQEKLLEEYKTDVCNVFKIAFPCQKYKCGEVYVERK